MSELKTLKEIEGNLLNGYFSIERRKLKAEAVKWVKEMEIYRSADYCDCLKDFIMEFFNLTEEDLKDE